MSKLRLIGDLDKISYMEYADQEALNKRLLEIIPKEAKIEFGIKYRSTLKKMRGNVKTPLKT